MKITDLKPGMRGVSVEGKIESITEPRTVNLRTGGTAQVADAIISGEWTGPLSQLDSRRIFAALPLE